MKWEKEEKEEEGKEEEEQLQPESFISPALDLVSKPQIRLLRAILPAFLNRLI